ncbi:unnamed protein product [Mytilus coruscus]|uniref:C2H2-type domain-containing protein n=1 Tax=Mytilus coruscus TaxID=42192 RepID=A0A6J8EQW1_MYTCO|nr:unnamed protein product [Mytilus coruscus]
MTSDVILWCQTCGPCARSKRGPGIGKSPMQHCTVYGPLECIAIDIMGPLPETDSGNNYIMVIGDYFSRWKEAFALPNHTAPVADKLTTEFICRFDVIAGAPPDNTETECPVKFVEWVKDALQRAYEFAHGNMESSFQTNKRYYDVKLKTRMFEINQLVWCWYPPKANIKLGLGWTGPYNVTRRLSDITYQITSCATGKSKIVHVNHLKPVVGDGYINQLTTVDIPGQDYTETESGDVTVHIDNEVETLLNKTEITESIETTSVVSPKPQYTTRGRLIKPRIPFTPPWAQSFRMDLADEYFNLLDYHEDDLDADLHNIQNQEMSQTFEFEVAKQAVSEELEDQDDSIQKIEFFFMTGGEMKCPIEGCTALDRKTCEDKHKIPHDCSIRNCTVTCRRRYDMKTHIKEVHREEHRLRIEDLTCKCEKTVMENRGYLDPGFLTFKGRTVKTASSTVSSSSSFPPAQAIQSTINTSSIAASNTTSTSSALTSTASSIPYFPSLIAATLNTSVDPEGPEYTVIVPSKNPSSSKSSSSNIISLQDYRHREKAPSTASDIRLVDYNTSFGIAVTTTTDGSRQTTSLELQPVVLPPIPDAKEELEGYIRWLCLSIDQFSRQREAVKQKLEEVRKECTRFEQERKLRRDLEAENRKPKRQLKENKWREQYLFPTEQ